MSRSRLSFTSRLSWGAPGRFDQAAQPFRRKGRIFQQRLSPYLAHLLEYPARTTSTFEGAT